MKKVKYCFIILHYQGYEDTLNCIKSIQHLKQIEKCKIVVIDNASPNKSGIKLQSNYLDIDSVDVLIEENNVGFSKANNDACIYAQKRYDPDYYIVLNNDVTIPEEDFLVKINNEYKKSHFSILGPDIYNPEYNIHQNPLCSKNPAGMFVDKTIYLNSILLKIAPYLKQQIVKYFAHIEKKQGNAVNFQRRQENVCLMGACFIFTRDFIYSKGKLFYPETFFYYEEYILKLYCEKTNKLMVYNPSLKVIHNSGQATKKSFSEEFQRDLFIVKNTINSAKIYRQYQKNKDE